MVLKRGDFAGVKRVGFDLDNTLYPVTDAMQGRIRQGIYQLAAQRLGRSVDEVRIEFEREYPKTGSGSRTLRGMGIELLESKALVQRAIETADIEGFIERDPILVQWLNKLSDAELGVDLITGTSQKLAEGKLRAIGIALDRFEVQLYSGDHAHAKSDGESFHTWMEQASKRKGLKIPPEQFVYIGDNERTDFEVPIGLGLRAVLIKPGQEEQARGDNYIVPNVYRACEIVLGGKLHETA